MNSSMDGRLSSDIVLSIVTAIMVIFILLRLRSKSQPFNTLSACCIFRANVIGFSIDSK